MDSSSFQPTILEFNGTLPQPGITSNGSGSSGFSIPASSAPATKAITLGDASVKSAGTGTHTVKAGLASMLKGALVAFFAADEHSMLMT
jgi:hypothetical protein